jgi:hypothetical protein
MANLPFETLFSRTIIIIQVIHIDPIAVDIVEGDTFWLILVFSPCFSCYVSMDSYHHNHTQAR